MPAAYSLTCPACGNPFLATLGEAATIVTCPHCAFNGPVQSFAASGIDRLGSTPSIPLRRREVRQRPDLHLSAPATPPPQPTAPPLFPEIPPPTRGHQDHQSRHFSPTSHPVGAPLTHHIPANPTLPPLPAAYPHLASPQGVPHQSSDNLPDQPLSRPRNLPLGKILLSLFAFGIIAAAAGYVYWEHQQELIRNRAADYIQPPTVVAPLPDKSPPQEVRSALPATADVTPLPADPELERNILAAEAPDFIQRLFTSEAADRHLLLEGAPPNDPSLLAFFAREPPITIGAVRRLPVAPIDLVSGRADTLFQVITSANPVGALARIYRAEDGNLRLHWPFFIETHDAALNHYLKTDSPLEPTWFHVAIRRSHGLDLAADLRNTHFVFDVQASGGTQLGTHLIAAKELPPGRFIDQKSAWQTVFFCHLLLQKKPLADGTQVLEVIDCAGASLTR